MIKRWTGPMVVMSILGGVILILALNLNPNRNARKFTVTVPNDTTVTVVDGKPVPEASPTVAQARTTVARNSPNVQGEFPIGEDVEKNQIRIAAVYLPPVRMEGMPDPASSGLIHLEADIHATEGNRNGFARDEFVPYLLVHYKIVPVDATAKSAPPIEGPMMPMVARDGLHYGANVEMPKAGRFKLTYAIEPPSKGGLGRHADSATGVDAWWQPFEVGFDWDYPGPP